MRRPIFLRPVLDSRAITVTSQDIWVGILVIQRSNHKTNRVLNLLEIPVCGSGLSNLPTPSERGSLTYRPRMIVGTYIVRDFCFGRPLQTITLSVRFGVRAFTLFGFKEILGARAIFRLPGPDSPIGLCRMSTWCRTYTGLLSFIANITSEPHVYLSGTLLLKYRCVVIIVS